jgi:hypothetical protein
MLKVRNRGEWVERYEFRDNGFRKSFLHHERTQEHELEIRAAMKYSTRLQTRLVLKLENHRTVHSWRWKLADIARIEYL